MRGWRKWAVPLAALALVAGACGDDDDDDQEPAASAPAVASVAITSPDDGASVKGNVVTLDLEVDGLRIVKADGDTSGRTGHFHVFIDKEPVGAGQMIPRESAIVHSADNPLKVYGLRTGRHTLTVVLGDGTHGRIGDSEAEVSVTVEGPTVDATAPATPAAGQTFPVDAAVEGVTLVKADGDTSGTTGHLHVFVDKEPVLGQPIPTDDPMIIHSATSPITVPALTAGEHTIWVVLGNGAHVPFDPPVMDKLTVTVQ